MTDERGTVKPDGTPADRRPHEKVPQWVIWVIIGAMIVGIIVTTVFVGLSLKNSYDIEQQAKGRQASTKIFCGIADSIVEQGQLVLVSSALIRGDSLQGVPPARVAETLLTQPAAKVAQLYQPGEVSKGLGQDTEEKFRTRLLAAQLAAQSYGQGIANRVSDEAEVQHSEIPRGSSGINCKVILQVARAGQK